MTYSELTLRHFRTARQAGVLQGPDTQRGSAGERVQGTWVQFDLRVTAGVVREAKFLAYGCPHVIAVADWVAQQAVDRSAPGLPEDIRALQQRFEVPIEKLGRLLIVEDAWIAARTPPI